MKHRTIVLWGTLVVVALAVARRRRSPSTFAEMPGEPWTLWGVPWAR